jgi:polyferredoxin
MDATRIALFFLGGFILLLAVVVELGSVLAFGTLGSTSGLTDVPRPGIGVRALVFVDVVLIYTLAMVVINEIPPLRPIFGRIQGILTLILSLIGVIVDIIFIFVTLALLILMVSLLLAAPFGTLLYFATWGDFDTGAVRAVLSLVMALKLAGLGIMVVSNPRLLKDKGLVFAAACSLLVAFLLGFLVAFPPSFLAAITDAVGALIAGVVGLVWMLIFLIVSILAVIRAIRSLLAAAIKA